MTTLAEQLERLAALLADPLDLRNHGYYNAAELVELVPQIIAALRAGEVSDEPI